MLYYILRRCLAAVLMLLVISAVTFRIFFASPTDPARLTCGKNCTPQSIAANRHFLGLDKPLTVQYGDFIKGLVSERNFPDDPEFIGQPRQGHPVPGALPRLLAAADPARDRHGQGSACRSPLSLALAAFVIWIVPASASASSPRSDRGRSPTAGSSARLDRATRSRASSSRLLAYNFLSIKWQLSAYPTYMPLTENPQPVVPGPAAARGSTLAAVFAAGYVRLTRAYMLETMCEDYIRTARAKGLHERTIVIKHTPARRADARSSPWRVSTSAGLLAGATITEQVFNFHGARAAPRSMPAIQLRPAGHRRRGPGGRVLHRHRQPDRRRAVRRDRPAGPLS